MTRQRKALEASPPEVSSEDSSRKSKTNAITREKSRSVRARPQRRLYMASEGQSGTNCAGLVPTNDRSLSGVPESEMPGSRSGAVGAVSIGSFEVSRVCGGCGES